MMPFRTIFNPTTFDDLRHEMNRLLNSHLGGLERPRPMRSHAFPAVNVWDDGPRLMAEAEVPGVEREDIDIHVLGEELTIKGRRHALEGEKLTYHRHERGTGEFARVLTLPVEVDADTVEAVLQDGVLTITLPKEESAKPRQIEVKVK